MTRCFESRPITRREALRQVGVGFGMAAFAQAASTVTGNPWSVKQPHFPPRAKHVIFLFLNGGLSQIDSFDYKPLLDKYDGKPLPYDMPRTEFAVGNLMKSPFKFQQYGRNGTSVSETLSPHGRDHRRLCIIRSMISDIPNHGPSMIDDEYRPEPGRTALDGLLDHLRIGNGKSEPAGIHRAIARGIRRWRRAAGALLFCPPSTRARSSPMPRATRKSRSST